MNIWRQINPFPKAVRDYMEYIKYMKWDIYNYDVGNKVWSRRQNLGVSYGGGVPRDVLEGGALSASLISRHHLNVSCCRAGAGYLKHKEAASWPLFGDSSLFQPTSPPIHSFPLLSKCCLILTVSIFSLSLWEQSVLDSVNVSCEKRCRKGENYHMSLFLHFTLGVKCLGFFSRFMWEKMSIRRELPHVTLLCISLWVKSLSINIT